MIVSTALVVAESETVPVVGMDTDLLVMLVAQETASKYRYMLCRSNVITVFNIHEVQHMA